MKRLMKWAAVSLTILLLSVCLLVLATVLILQSEGGSRFLINQAVNRLDALSIEKIQGNLFQGLDLQGIAWRDKGIELDVQRLQLHMDLSALLRREVTIHRLHLDDSQLRLSDMNTQQDEPFALFDIDIPLSILLSDLVLNRTVIDLDGTVIAIEQFSASAHWQQDQLYLEDLQLIDELYQFQARGNIRFTGAWPLNMDVLWQAELSDDISDIYDSKQARGNAHLGGTVEHLRINQILHRPVRMAGSIELRPLLETPSFFIEQQWRPFMLNLDDIRLQLAVGSIEAQGTINDYTLALQTTVTLDELLPIAININGKGDMQSLDLETLLLESDSGQLGMTGRLEWLSDIAWQLQGTAANLDWSVIDAQLEGRAGFDFASKGHYGETIALQLTLEQLHGQINHYPLDDIAVIKLEGSGTDTRFDFSTLDMQTGSGEMALQGSINWNPFLAWNIHGDIKHFNPAIIRQELAGDISFFLRSEGDYQNTLDVDLDIQGIEGFLRDYPVSGQSQWLLQNSGEMISSDTAIRLGDNQLTLLGSMAEKLDMILDVQADNLASVWPDLAGNLALNARLSGSRAQPLLEANMQVHELAWQTLSLESLEATMSASDQDDISMELMLEGHQLRQGYDQYLEHFVISGDGHRDDHRLSWQLKQQYATVNGRLHAGLNETGDWHAVLEQLDVAGELTGNWALQESSRISVGSQEMKLARTCLQEEQQARLCMHGNIQGDSGQGDIELTDLSLSSLSVFIQQPVVIDGQLGARASASWQDGQLHASLFADAGAGNLQWLEEDEEAYRVDWHTARLDANVENNQLSANWQMLLNEDDRISGNLSSSLEGNYPLQGQWLLQLADIHWLELFLPVRNVAGTINGELLIKGNITRPVLTGNIMLEDGGMQVPDAGITLEDINLSANARDTGIIDLAGTMQSGGGQLRISGGVDTRAVIPWPVRVNVEGENVLLLDRLDAVVRVNPDLRLKIADKLVQVRGDVVVSQAQLRPRELPRQAVRVTADERLVDQQREPGWQIDNDIIVVLGDQVSVQGFGLDARFVGDVRLTDKPGQPLLLYGVVRIEDGRYRAYGQNLHVERGNLYFQGPPDNPGLDILAVRIIAAHNVRAGLEIGGTLQDPRSTVVSTPAMEETEAMAWLLTGRPLSGASESDGNAILQAIAVYGIEQGDFISDRLGETLGIDVGFDTEGETEQAAFMLGKQLSSRLYLRYSVGLFESISTVMLRYSLSQEISLETRSSGESQSIDLLYRTERD